jgi:hypothetical protein
VTKALAPLLVLTIAIAAGCGTNEHAVLAAKTSATGRTCDSAPVPGFRTCMSRSIPLSPSIERWTGSSWKVVTGPLPQHHEPDANWYVVSLSPDRSTLLAEWSYPCDSAAVVFVPAAGGAPRIATGEKDWLQAPVAHALGWTRDGKARVRVYTNWRGHRITPMHPRTFLIDPDASLPDAQPAPPRGC